VAGTDGRHSPVADWIRRLGAAYPDDPGVVVVVLLNLVRLRPGESLHLPAGNLHAYLSGTAVEVMATSDNVIRGGLTVKHVDVEGLLAAVDTHVSDDPRVRAVGVEGGESFPTDTPQFALERLLLSDVPLSLARRGPEILLALDGVVEASADTTALALQLGQAAFVPARTRRLAVTGEGTLIRATTGQLSGAARPLAQPASR
jgi:mannose-6-phosphate isomerase